jgi:hypothetical protein
MFKKAAIAASILFICGMTFVIIPSAFSFEDYITSEPMIQEEGEVVETEEAPVMGGGGMYYEESQDETEPIEEQEDTEQVELQETEELEYEAEQIEIR